MVFCYGLRNTLRLQCPAAGNSESSSKYNGVPVWAGYIWCKERGKCSYDMPLSTERYLQESWLPTSLRSLLLQIQGINSLPEDGTPDGHHKERAPSQLLISLSHELPSTVWLCLQQTRTPAKESFEALRRFRITWNETRSYSCTGVANCRNQCKCRLIGASLTQTNKSQPGGLSIAQTLDVLHSFRFQTTR
jgi:hypothetical protein